MTPRTPGEAAEPDDIGGKKQPVALVLGHRGLLGQALTRSLAAHGWQTHGLDRAERNPLDPDVLRPMLEETAPDAIFNTIAWTQVDDAEAHPQEALAVNRGLPALLGNIVRNSGSTAARQALTRKMTNPRRSPSTAKANWPGNRRCWSRPRRTSAWCARPGSSARGGGIS